MEACVVAVKYQLNSAGMVLAACIEKPRGDRLQTTNYVDKFLAVFNHLHPFVDSFYLKKIDIFGLLPT